MHPQLFKVVPRPNLFNFALCERSQDAFICWLLCWAHQEYASSDGPLHAVARTLLDRLIGLCGIDPPTVYDDMAIHTQHKGIDILALLNGGIALLIEDKVDACEHADQLRRYSEVVRRDFPGKTVARVYLKTGHPGYGEEDSVGAAGFRFFSGGDLLTVLEEGERLGVANAVYREFLAHLRDLQQEVADRAMRARGPRRHRSDPDEDGTCLFRLSGSV